MKKVLMLASVASMISQFNLENIRILKELRYEIHVACNFTQGNTCDIKSIENLKKELREKSIPFYQIDFARQVSRIRSNYKAYRQVKALLEINKYNFIHCHSPIGGVVGRLAGYERRIKVVYTAHGFHFFKRAPLKNWLLYYPVERGLSRCTDTIITINREDYERAATKFKAKRVEHIPGVGVNIQKFNDPELSRYLNCEDYFEKKRLRRKKLCDENHIPEDAILLLSVGELNANKNHKVIIKALKKLKMRHPESAIHYCIAGRGDRLSELKALAEKCSLRECVHFLGYREDINELYRIVDIFAFPSRREGLGMAAVEAMASGLPLITSNVHGINDYSVNGETGYKCDPDDTNGFADAIFRLIMDRKKMFEMGRHNQQVAQNFSSEFVKEKMFYIYRNLDEYKS